VDEWRKHETEKMHILQKAKKAKTEADKHLAKAQMMYEQEANRSVEREKAAKKLDRLQELLPVVKEIDSMKQKLGKQKEEAARLYRDLHNIKAAISAQTEAVEKDK